MAKMARAAREPHGSATSLASAVLTDVLGFQGGIARDDIAIVAVRVPD